MVDFIIGLGNIDKKLLLPFIYILLYILINIYHNYNTDDVVTLYLEGFGHSIGDIIIFLVFNIIRFIRYKVKFNIIEKKPVCNYFKDYIFLFMIDCFYMLMY